MALVSLFSCNQKLNEATASVQESKKYSTEEAEIEKKIDALLAQMTLKEKVGQMNQYNGTWDVTGPAPKDDYNALRYEHLTSGQVGSMLNVLSVKNIREAQQLAVEKTRLGIPLIFGYDVIHGYQTMFPIPLGETASWEMDLLEKSSQIAAKEAAAAGLNWTFAPMVDVGRDARWGRVMEGAGEDPYLGTQAALARVKGFQGNDLKDENTIAACIKHFAGYAFAESGKDYNTADVSDLTIHNVILPPFKACAEAGAATFMNGFNQLQGVPVTGSSYLQRDLLKKEWNFDGFIVSDWGSIGEMIMHGHAKDKKAAAQIAANAGSDMDMESNCYVENLEELVKEGKVDVKNIDDAVRRILRVKHRLGLFDDPYKYCNEEREKNSIYTKEHLQASREIAKRSIVLLKNENNLLPLSKNEPLALIGPFADDKDVSLGNWRGQAIKGSAVSLKEGIANVIGEDKISYEKGCEHSIGERAFIFELSINQEAKDFEKALAIAKNTKTVVVAMGEDCYQSGEGRSQANIGMLGVQEELLKEIYAVNQNIVLVLMNGRPMAIPWAAQNIPAIVEAWHLGSEAGNAIADVIFGDYNPSGKLPVTFPKSVGQVPIYYNHHKTGRNDKSPNNMVFWSHYTDEVNEPTFSFGHGLSYTTFEYKNLGLSTQSLSLGASIKVSVKLSNVGKVAGEEVVQLYIEDLFSTTARPIRELKGFQKVALEPGESKIITFDLHTDDLAYYTANKKWETELGTFKVHVGGSVATTKEVEFEVVETTIEDN